MASRLDVRLDPSRRQRLEEMAREKGVPISALIRSLIDDAYDGVLLERRKRAVEELVGLGVEETPDSGELGRELEEAHEPGGLH